MSKVFQPVNQVRLTNVAVVRYKAKGKRFEIACYKNKVMNWRNKIEKDLDEVLQSHKVFTNVSKGTVAKKSDLEKVFGTDDEEWICITILEKGELQVSDKERQAELESKGKDVVTIIAEKCIDSETKRPIPPRLIESALKEINFTVQPNKSAKQQALAAIQELKKVLPIERAQMRLRLEIPNDQGKDVKVALAKIIATVEEEKFDKISELIVLIEPGAFRTIEEEFQKLTKGKGTLEIIDLQVKEQEDDASLT